MIVANEMTADEWRQAIETDREDQFEAMDYTVACNTCGGKIIGCLLSADFDRPGLIKGPGGIQDAMVAHNMTHYRKPIVLGYTTKQNQGKSALAWHIADSYRKKAGYPK